nr:unnamed protein product [Callosobruchus analis]
MAEKDLCDICNKVVKNDEDGLLCEQCVVWKHRKCIGMTMKTYVKLSESKSGWNCQACIDENKQSRAVMSGQLTDIMNKLQEMDKKYDSLLQRYSEQVKINEDLQTEVTEIKNKLNKAEQKLLTNNMIVHGIPFAENENPKEIVKNIGKFLQIPADQYNFDCYRLGKDNNSSSNSNKTFLPIKVAFEEAEMKNQFIKSPKRFQLKCQSIGLRSNNTIFLNHDLTKTNLELLKKAQQFKKENHYKFLWIKNGSILLRKEEKSKVVMVQTEQDIANLVSRNWK